MAKLATSNNRLPSAAAADDDDDYHTGKASSHGDENAVSGKRFVGRSAKSEGANARFSPLWLFGQLLKCSVSYSFDIPKVSVLSNPSHNCPKNLFLKYSLKEQSDILNSRHIPLCTILILTDGPSRSSEGGEEVGAVVSTLPPFLSSCRLHNITLPASAAAHLSLREGDDSSERPRRRVERERERERERHPFSLMEIPRVTKYVPANHDFQQLSGAEEVNIEIVWSK